jgi:hypothetical protein
LVLALGAFGALVPFVGPYFDFQIGTRETWDWSLDRFWLSVLPGGLAVLGGLIMIGSFRRLSASFGGLLALAGGLWFIVGPTVSMLWNDGSPATGAAFGDTATRAFEWLAFFYGTGGLITLLAAYEVGFLAALPVRDEAVLDRGALAGRGERVAGGPAPAERPGEGSVREPVESAPRRGRFLRRERTRARR